MDRDNTLAYYVSELEKKFCKIVTSWSTRRRQLIEIDWSNVAPIDSTIKLVSFIESTNIFYEAKQLSFYQGKALLIAIIFKNVCFSILDNVKFEFVQWG